MNTIKKYYPDVIYQDEQIYDILEIKQGVITFVQKNKGV
jgi:hypothetical protein